MQAFMMSCRSVCVAKQVVPAVALANWQWLHSCSYARARTHTHAQYVGPEVEAGAICKTQHLPAAVCDETTVHVLYHHVIVDDKR